MCAKCFTFLSGGTGATSGPAAAPRILLDGLHSQDRLSANLWVEAEVFTKPPANPGTRCSFRSTGTEVNKYGLRVREIQVEVLATLFCDLGQVT